MDNDYYNIIQLIYLTCHVSVRERSNLNCTNDSGAYYNIYTYNYFIKILNFLVPDLYTRYANNIFT